MSKPSPKFLIDEDVPSKLTRFLRREGFDAAAVSPSSSDIEIARRAKTEGRVVVTLDKDFSNTGLFPPEEFDIVLIRVHPPSADSVVEAFKRLLSRSPLKLKGLTLLGKEGEFRFP